ncbi:MAG: hypothetical protein GXP37_07805 [Chloroflexi bacterium]|nr:hypothetical protein [Chloroflexota bacterium]
MSSCQLDTAKEALRKGINLRFDTDTIDIERSAVLPYPDLQRIWVRIQLSNFATPPDIRLSCSDATGNEIAEMLLVEWRDPYISLTMHLHQPQPGAEYTLQVEIARNGELLTTHTTSFALVFKDNPT